MATTARTATTVPRSFKAIERKNGRIVAGSAETMSPSRMRCGQSSAVMTPPTTASLTRPLAKFASAWRENRRPKPAIGEIRDSCGLTSSVVKTTRCCTMLPANAATHRTRSGTPKAARTSKASVFISAVSAGPSVGI